MNINVVKDSARQLSNTIAKKSPTILTSLGVGGLITTVIFAVKATPKALDIIDGLVFEANSCDEEVEKMDIIKATWKCYIPTIVMGGITVGCIIGSNNINMRRNAALASLYSISETTLKEYQAKVVEQIGVNKAEKIKDEIAKDRLEKDPITDHQVIFTGKGDTLCYEVLSGRYFKSDIDKIKKAENKLVKDLLLDNFISLNDVYDELGLDSTKMGDDIGWRVDIGMLAFDFRSQLSTDGTPCLVIDYVTEPTYEYLESH